MRMAFFPSGLLVCAMVTFGTSAADRIVNPVLPGFHSDPSVCRGHDGRFHLAVSSLQFFPGLPLFVSDDLVNWTSEGYAFTDPNDMPMFDRRDVTGLFAPTYRYQGGQYHLIVTNNGDRPDGRRDGVLYGTAERPNGPWSFRRVDVPGGDPSIDFIDGEWRYTATTGREIVSGVFDPSAGALTTPAKTIWSGTGGVWPEGPHLLRKGDWYYLLLAEGGTGYGHKCVIARSRSVDGPYEACPHNPLLTHACPSGQDNAFQGVGHGDFISDGSGAWWYVCHAFRRQNGKHHLIGRETMLAGVEWTDGGWPRINGGRPLSDGEFNETRLPARARTHIRNPDLRHYAFSGDRVRLTASENGLSDFGSPTFVGTRQTAIRQSFAAVLAAADGDVSAGVVAYMNRPAHYALVVKREGGRRTVCLRSVLAGKTYVEKSIPVPEGELDLRIDASADEYRFSVGGTCVASGPARLISSETDDSYTGVILGVFAEGRGEAEFRIEGLSTWKGIGTW